MLLYSPSRSSYTTQPTAYSSPVWQGPTYGQGFYNQNFYGQIVYSQSHRTQQQAPLLYGFSINGQQQYHPAAYGYALYSQHRPPPMSGPNVLRGIVAWLPRDRTGIDPSDLLFACPSFHPTREDKPFNHPIVILNEQNALGRVAVSAAYQLERIPYRAKAPRQSYTKRVPADRILPKKRP
ncbi:hypothetical protein BT63DRAFT_460865 [Microthyrium microscopicum]|uniref:Uncharacterized protein n=1 Tax=Microthyrium microscopicum TaxID=703497 RepID=A0A6A6TYJ5_9PEZI|nr:hypothetical protein BT63DRAFT_460865 [Microthyrium microscopicum]